MKIMPSECIARHFERTSCNPCSLCNDNCQIHSVKRDVYGSYWLNSRGYFDLNPNKGKEYIEIKCDHGTFSAKEDDKLFNKFELIYYKFLIKRGVEAAIHLSKIEESSPINIISNVLARTGEYK